MQRLSVLCITLCLLGACVKNELYNTPHPKTAGATFTPTWSGVTAPNTAPNWMKIDSLTPFQFTVGQSIDTIAPGAHRFLAGNVPAGFQVSGTTLILPIVSGKLSAQPAWVFAGRIDTTLRADTDYELSLPMRQMMREVTFTVNKSQATGGTFADISAITATLTGVAGNVDLATGASGGTAYETTPLPFVKSADGNSWTGTMRLTGVIGATQTLSLSVTYNLSGQSISAPSMEPRNIHDLMGNFDASRATPLTIPLAIRTPNTNHPNAARVTITTDWSNHLAGMTPAPPLFPITVSWNGGAQTASSTSITLSSLLAPDSYRFLAYNSAAAVTVSDGVATVSEAMPGWLFSGVSAQQELKADTAYNLPVVMQQRMGQVTFTIRPADDAGQAFGQINGITGTLSGVAGKIDLVTGAVSQPIAPSITFTKIGDNWVGVARLLGTIGTTNLALTIDYPAPMQPTILPAQEIPLSGLNGDKLTPHAFNAAIRTPSSPGLPATITDWVDVTGGGNAYEQ